MSSTGRGTPDRTSCSPSYSKFLVTQQALRATQCVQTPFLVTVRGRTGRGVPEHAAYSLRASAP